MKLSLLSQTLFALVLCISCVEVARDPAGNNTANTANTANNHNTTSTTTANNGNNTNTTATTTGDSTSCVTAIGQAENVELPVDIIWVVDNSGSMDWEEQTVEQGINDFAALIALTGLDYHVILLSDNSICVPEPLGGPDCTDSQRFRHVPVTIDSDNALQTIVDAYPLYSDFMRSNSKVNYVVVSDDDSIRDADWFEGHVEAFTDPEVRDDWVFHCVVAQGGLPVIGCCSMNGCGAQIGEAYLELSNRTNGIAASICEEDWTPIFTSIATNIATGTTMPCAYEIPSPGPGQVIDPQEINVQFTPTGDATPTFIPMVATEFYCDQTDGWYYDDALDPQWVILCDDTCDITSEGELQIVFGCDTIVQ